jgi:hypothetical protein
LKLAGAIVLCRRATANSDGTTTLDGLFDVVSLRSFPDRLTCSAYCKLEAEPTEIGATRKVRLDLTPVGGAPLASFEREATIKGAAYDATPTLEILWDLDVLIERPGNYRLSVAIGARPAGSAPILISPQPSA